MAKGIVFPLTLGNLTDDGATPWSSRIGLGTPVQNFKFMIDSGTDNTWVTSKACTTNACLAHGRFDAKQSKSYEVIDPAHVQKDFGPWGIMTVIMGADIFTLELADGHVVQTQETLHFEAAIHYTGCQFQVLACDGGIAIPSPYWKKQGIGECLMLQLIKNGKLDRPLAAFWMDHERAVGACTFGFCDQGKYQPETLQWLPLQDTSESPLDYLWSVKLDELLVGGKKVEANIQNFILDSGSSFFKGPSDLIDSIIQTITRNGVLPTYVSSEKELDLYPEISLVLGGKHYSLMPVQYFLKLNKEYWEIGIQTLVGMPEGMLLVGSLFLDSVYTIFDYGGKQLGLADRN